MEKAELGTNGNSWTARVGERLAKSKPGLDGPQRGPFLAGGPRAGARPSVGASVFPAGVVRAARYPGT